MEILWNGIKPTITGAKLCFDFYWNSDFTKPTKNDSTSIESAEVIFMAQNLVPDCTYARGA